MPTNAPEYQVPYYKEWYQRNKEVHKANASARRAAIAAQNRLELVLYLGKHPCVDCGETDIIVLQFDHVRGKKRGNISEMISGGFPWKTILSEIEKCEVRCANDHLRRTAKEQKFFKAKYNGILV